MSNKEVIQAMKLSEAYSILEDFDLDGKHKLKDAIITIQATYKNKEEVDKANELFNSLEELTALSMELISKEVKEITK